MKKCQGQSLVQFIILMPLFFSLLFGVFEMTYVYRAKATLNTATFEAARAGSLHHAQIAPMKTALINGMLPQYIKGDSSVLGLGKAYAQSVLYEKAMSKKLSTIDVISPTKEIFNAYKVKRMYKLNSDSKEKFQWVMPNDNLNVRSTTAKNITVSGKAQKINIQDANLLKIKTYWCYELKVPVLKDVAFGIFSGGLFGVGASPEQKACNVGALFGKGRYLAISSQAVVRMQSPVVDASLK